MKVFLADDEYYALQGLKHELEQYEDIEVLGLYDNGADMLEDLERLSPEVIIADIEMPGINGFQVVEHLRRIGLNTRVVFVTAYNHYAVKAFEVNVADYLIKPVKPERLARTLERLRCDRGIRNYRPNSNKLQIQCFKRFSIMSDNNEISGNWRTRKAEELLAYLSCEQGQFVSKDKLAEMLWPDLDGEKSLSNLYLAYHYIKKQEKKLGISIPIESQRGKMRLCIEETDCDLVQFESCVKELQGYSERKQIQRLESACKLYQGELLEENYYPWSLTYQKRYELMLHEVFQTLVKYYEDTGETAKLKYYERQLMTLFE